MPAGTGGAEGGSGALRALLADADAFGMMGWGAPRREKTAEPRPVLIDAPSELAKLAEEVAACRKCPLGGLRTHAVPGQGSPKAELMFVGEAPGADEDAQGLAFVGAAGQLLTKMIGAMGLTRDEVFIANILKCRPPDNREPHPDEVAQCLPYLDRQLALIGPKVVCALGSHAARNLLGVTTAVGKLRGQVHEAHGTRIVVTYHPAYLLRSPGEKSKAWEDLKLVLRILGRPVPS
jgi:uracil-DNA glycosylase family 4